MIPRQIWRGISHHTLNSLSFGHKHFGSQLSQQTVLQLTQNCVTCDEKHDSQTDFVIFFFTPRFLQIGQAFDFTAHKTQQEMWLHSRNKTFLRPMQQMLQAFSSAKEMNDSFFLI